MNIKEQFSGRVCFSERGTTLHTPDQYSSLLGKGLGKLKKDAKDGSTGMKDSAL